MGYSWECGRLLLRTCHNAFWFCGILTDRLVSKIFRGHWLNERSRRFAWFSQKLQWFNKNTQFSIYSIWNIYSTSTTLPIQKKETRLGEKLWVLIIWTVSTAGLCLNNCKRLFHITPKNINIVLNSFEKKYFWMQHHHFHLLQGTIYRLQRRSSLLLYFVS